jgi:tetratricopeptide (TPR) repeat protein
LAPEVPVTKPLLLVVLCLGLTLPSVGFDFVGDDFHLISLNPVVTGPFSLRGLMGSTIVLDQAPKPFYRPMQFLALALEHRLFGLSPWGYHLASVLAHTLNVLLVFGIGKLLFPHPWAALMGAALFAIHPVHAEAVAFVSAQGDLLGTLFVLLAFLAVMAASRAATRPGIAAAAAAAALAYLAAVLSKEAAILLPIVFLAYLWSERGAVEGSPSRARACLIVGCALGLSGLLYLAVRVSVLSGLGIEGSLPDPGGALRRFAWYARLLVDPTAIRAFWPPVPSGWDWLSVAGALLVSAGSLLAFRPGEGRSRRIFLWLWFLLALLPTLKLFPYPGTDLAARYLYLPSVAAAWGVTMIAPGLAGVVTARTPRGSAAVFTTLLLLALSFFWYREQNRWKDRISVYTRIARDAPDWPMPHFNLGNVMREAGRIDEAVREYRTALRLDPDYAGAQCNLGVLLSEAGGDPIEARDHLRACLDLSPQAPNRDYVLTLIERLGSRPSVGR